MEKIYFLCVLFLLFLLSNVAADHIIPPDDPVYSFLETAQNLCYTAKLTSVYPLYHDEILCDLTHILSLNIAVSYKKLAKYHLKRLSLENEKGVNSAVYPIKKIPQSLISILTDQLPQRTLFSYNNKDTNLFLSGILGVDYDLYKSDNDDKHRLLKYYGLEFGGNLTNNIGLYSLFKKGHYTGDAYFTKKDSAQLIADNWENPEKIEIQTECFIKNNIIDAAIGYGNFQIGNSITKSIILTKDISSIPYIKISKEFGDFSYISLYGQLVPDSIRDVEEYSTKSLALQMISYQTEKLYLAIGENALYDDRNFEIAYSTPLIMYKLIDFANQSRDNVNAFIITNYIPFTGLMLYNNLFIDDVKMSRLTTDEWISGFADQLGISYSFESTPMNITFEGTAVGPRTYHHRRDLTYSHRDQLLGFQYGSNLLNLAFQIQYLMPALECKVLYTNMQQGSISSDPFQPGQGPNARFLAGSISRTQRIDASVNYNITSHLNVHLQYIYENKNDREKTFLYSGIELKY
jgi:hypothetical protein